MKIISVVVLVIVAYFVWRFVVRGDGLVLITHDTGKGVTGVLKNVVPAKELLIEITNNGKERRITQISMPRSVASQLGLTEPSGFRVEELPLTEGEKKDKEMVAFVKQYNKDNLRWVGEFTLPAESKAELAIPAPAISPLAGSIDFQYEGKVGLGGSISHFRVNLAGQGRDEAINTDTQGAASPSPQS